MRTKDKKGRFLSSSSKEEKRSLYDCLEAKVKDDRIRCAKGHALKATSDGCVPIISLKRGMSLNYAPCQNCPDFNPHDGPCVAEKDKGW